MPGMLPQNLDLSKVMVMTDLHLGLKNNSKQHNTWCEQFVDWMIEESASRGIRTFFFLGDFHHARHTVNVDTLNYSTRILRKINNYYDNSIFLLGNHDLYYRDNLKLHSLPYIEEFPNIHLIDSIVETDLVAFVPWLVGDQWKEIPKVKSQYMFCHAEIAKFRMNASVEMPDHGGLTQEHFANQKLVMSGHFHKRQRKGKILYMGNAFPHNFADVHDDARGCMIWQPHTEPEFIQWDQAPKYRTWDLSQVLVSPTTYIDERTFVKINVDVQMNYEDLNFVKELFEVQLKALDVTWVHTKVGSDTEFSDEEITFESVDQIVLDHLNSIESVTMDRELLTQIYQSI